jgi:hypothetical protein
VHHSVTGTDKKVLAVVDRNANSSASTDDTDPGLALFLHLLLTIGRNGRVNKVCPIAGGLAQIKIKAQ